MKRSVSGLKNIDSIGVTKNEDYLKRFFKQKKRLLKLTCSEYITTLCRGYKKN